MRSSQRGEVACTCGADLVVVARLRAAWVVRLRLASSVPSPASGRSSSACVIESPFVIGIFSGRFPRSPGRSGRPGATTGGGGEGGGGGRRRGGVSLLALAD